MHGTGLWWSSKCYPTTSQPSITRPTTFESPFLQNFYRIKLTFSVDSLKLGAPWGSGGRALGHRVHQPRQSWPGLSKFSSIWICVPYCKVLQPLQSQIYIASDSKACGQDAWSVYEFDHFLLIDKGGNQPAGYLYGLWVYEYCCQVEIYQLLSHKGAIIPAMYLYSLWFNEDCCQDEIYNLLTVK